MLLQIRPLLKRFVKLGSGDYLQEEWSAMQLNMEKRKSGQKACSFSRKLINLLNVIYVQPKTNCTKYTIPGHVNFKSLSVFCIPNYHPLPFCSCQKQGSINLKIKCYRKHLLFFRVSSVRKQKKVLLQLCGNLIARDSVGRTRKAEH